MCLYHYLYFSKCQHAQLSRISYCDTAKALGLSERDGLSQRTAGAGQTAARQQSPPLYHTRASSSTHHRRASHPHIQQQQQHSMTLVHFETSAPPAWSSNTANREQSPPCGSASIPRSALEGYESNSGDNDGPATLKKSRSLRNSNFALPLDAQSPLSIEISEPVNPGLPGDSACWSSTLEGPAAQNSLDTSAQTGDERRTLGHIEDDSHSPRKPIPSQWLHKTSAPRLATAQRAKVRETKKDSPSGSPIDHKPPRSARSFHAADGATFLTKEALAAVESDITSPTSRHSPTKQQQSKTKPSWNSPVQLPKHDTLRKAANSSIRLSPSKATLLSPTTGEHKESMKDVTTQGSPIKRDPVGSKPQASKTMISPSTKPPKLQLFVDIPGTPPHSDSDPRSASTLASATSSSAGSGCLGTPTSPSQSSRIPRPFTGGNTGNARGPTLSSSLKRTKSVVSLGSPKAASNTEPSPTVGKSSLRRSDRSTPRHVRTLDSSGATPVMTDHLMQSRYTSPCTSSTSSEITLDGASSVEQSIPSRRPASRHQEEDAINATLKNISVYDEGPCPEASRATSTSTVKAAPKATSFWDPATVDSAVLYSRKKPGFTNTRNDDAATNLGHPGESTADSSPVRGRSKQYFPTPRKPTPSDMSIPSSLASDLRATAPEFVPTPKDTSMEETIILPPSMAAVLPDMYSVDAYGLPWYYHMYPYHWSHPTGFYNGRSRSPKKFYPRKQRQNFASSNRNHNFHHNTYPSKTEAPATPYTKPTRAQLPSFQKPVSPMTLLEQNKNADFQMSASTQPARTSPSTPPSDLTNSEDATHDKGDGGPFSHQIDMVSRQAAMHDTAKTLRGCNVDLTTVHNVPAMHGRHTQNHSGSPSRHGGHRRGNNGLYNGRGVAGIPMSATAPFPSPMAPHGKPVQMNEGPTRYVGYTVGTDACGSVNVEVAAERGGEACDNCDPSV